MKTDLSRKCPKIDFTIFHSSHFRVESFSDVGELTIDDTKVTIELDWNISLVIGHFNFSKIFLYVHCTLHNINSVDDLEIV